MRAFTYAPVRRLSKAAAGLSVRSAVLCTPFSSNARDGSPRSSTGIVALAALLTAVASFDSTTCTGSSAPAEVKTYRKAEVSKHASKETGIWMIYQNGVYDVTKFVVNHPGGMDKIMLAAGGNIEPFWQLYPIHTRSKLPASLLAEMKIGVLHPDDVAAEEASLASEASRIGDPYSKEPKPSPLLQFHSQKPTNAEAPNSLLTDSWITPKDLWFIRNHHPVPVNQGDNHRVTLKLAPDKTVEYSVGELKTKFPRRDVTTTIQCGGNRRSEMNRKKVTSGSPWLCGAASTATWSGVYLSDVLRKEGIDYYNVDETGAKHVQMVSVDGLEASIPVRKAVDVHGEVLLTYDMNGEPLPSEFGGPLRVIVPGHVGVRNVKWISSICLAGEEAQGPWQRGMAYKGFSPSTTTLEGIDVEAIPSLQEQPVQSIIAVPRPNTNLTAGSTQTLKGWAYSGGGRGIVRVDVSIDGGKTWKTAHLTDGAQQPLDKAWAWTFWTIDADIPESLVGQELEIICKATDSSYNVQPDSIDGIWNLRGINNNAWHRIKVKVVQEEEEDEE
jgi:sulfite oxidase